MRLPNFKGWMMPRPVAAVLATSAMIASSDALAWRGIYYSNLSNGYSNCTYQNNGNGTSTLGVTISYKNIQGHLGRHSGWFQSRGILIYTYEKDGKLQQSGHYASAVYMDGVRHWGRTSGIDYASYDNSDSRYATSWRDPSARVVRVTVVIDNKHLAPWPAIGVRAANVTQKNDIVEITGLAYIGADSSTGNCNTITDPKIPPPPEAPKILMTAPDWNLGELLPGAPAERPFSGAGEELCFTYDHLKWTGSRYAINATNQNGLSGNGWYQLKHLTSPSDTVPYRVVLRNATTSTEVALPNTGNVVSALGNNGRDCFIPTFTADTPKAAKEGDYSDVLTFTVVARP